MRATEAGRESAPLTPVHPSSLSFRSIPAAWGWQRGDRCRAAEITALLIPRNYCLMRRQN